MVPVTVIIVLLLVRPFLRNLISRATRLEIGSFEIENISDTETKEGQSFLEQSRKTIAEGLKDESEESKDKLERLRLALETEQVNQLIQYHANSLAQSKISFWFSIGAALVGFLVIVISLLYVFFSDSNINTGIIGLTSGAIIDAVAALFFAQSNQARRLMTDFFDKLRKDRQFNESLRLTESISDENIQSLIKAQLSLFFAGFPASSIFSSPIEKAFNDSVKSPIEEKEDNRQ